MRLTDEIYTQYPFFGTRQMANYLRLQGYQVSRDRLRGICPDPVLSKRHPEHKIYPYLLRGMAITKGFCLFNGGYRLV